MEALGISSVILRFLIATALGKRFARKGRSGVKEKVLEDSYKTLQRELFSEN
jgi:hypothetical protein